MTALAGRFVEWSWSLNAADLPPGVRAAARRHLVDGWGCALAAARLDAARAALEVARQVTAPREAVVPGIADKLPVAAAAFATGALVHALDFDDTHPEALVHPTATVLPVLSSVGQLVGADPETLEAAAVAGYEMVIRLGAAVPHGFHARGFHATSVCGIFAATLVAARLLDLTQEQAVHALGIAGSAAAGSLEFLDTGASTKALHPALMAQAAVTVARLAAAGATGPATILEGRYGLFAAYLQVPPPTRITDDLGARWEVTRIELKPYPCCHLSHASLEALDSLSLQAADVAKCVIELPEPSVPIVAEPRQHKLRPRTSYEAKFSLPWTAAALLLDGAVTADTFIDVNRPDVAKLAERVEVRPVMFDAPPATAPGRVHVQMNSGNVAAAVTRGKERRDLDAMATEKFVANAGGGERSRAFAAELIAHGWRNP